MNEKAINVAVEKYEKLIKKDFLLHPVSDTDKNIIVKLYSLCVKLGAKEVEQVMENYKMHPDSEILSELDKILSATKDKKDKPKIPRYSDFVDTEKEEKELYTMIKFSDVDSYRIYRPNIISYFRGEDEEGVPFIMINPCDETLKSQPIHANTILIYTDEEDRDKDFKILDDFYE